MAETERRRNIRPVLRGYIKGVANAAAYIAIDLKTFRLWRDDPNLTHRHLLQPRIIRGDTYYSLRNLDAFMDPAKNPPDASIVNHFSASEDS